MTLINRMLESKLFVRGLDYMAKKPLDVLLETRLPLGKLSLYSAIIGASLGTVSSSERSRDLNKSFASTALNATGATVVTGAIGSIIPPVVILAPHVFLRAAVIGAVAGTVLSPLIIPVAVVTAVNRCIDGAR